MATSEIKVTGLEDLERVTRMRTEERRREVALECASRAWVKRTAPYSVARSVIETAREFENYLRGDAA